MTASVDKVTKERQEEHAKKLKLIQEARTMLSEENTELRSDLKTAKSQLRQIQAELFDVRQELLVTNEQLKEATLPWYQKVVLFCFTKYHDSVD